MKQSSTTLANPARVVLRAAWLAACAAWLAACASCFELALACAVQCHATSCEGWLTLSRSGSRDLAPISAMNGGVSSRFIFLVDQRKVRPSPPSSSVGEWVLSLLSRDT